MRNLYIGFSILCFSLSGVITYKALNLPEKKPLNPSVETLQNTTSQPEHKSANEIAALQDTFKQFLQKIINKDNVSQVDTQTSKKKSSQLEQKLANENTTAQLEQKLTDKIADSQKNIQVLEDTVKHLEQKMADKIAREQKDTQSTENTTDQLERKLTDKIIDSQKNIQSLEDTVKWLEQKLINNENASKIEKRTSKNIIAQQEYTPSPLKNVSQSKSNISEPKKTEKLLAVLVGDLAFSSGKFVINDNMTKLIQKSAQYILTFPHYRVIIEGHTNNVPIIKIWQKRFKDNMDLSFFRAKAVAREFEKQGIPFKRISVIGYGDTRPIASNDTEEGRAKNRRVVVRLIPEE